MIGILLGLSISTAMTTVPAVDRPEEGRNILAEVQNAVLHFYSNFTPTSKLERTCNIAVSCYRQQHRVVQHEAMH